MAGEMIYRMKGRVVLRRIGADRLLVPVAGLAARKNCVFPLNNTGVFIWERLSAGQPLGAVAQALTEAFEVSKEEALFDCQKYAGDLVAQQLLEGAAK